MGLNAENNTPEHYYYEPQKRFSLFFLANNEYCKFFCTLCFDWLNLEPEAIKIRYDFLVMNLCAYLFLEAIWLMLSRVKQRVQVCGCFGNTNSFFINCNTEQFIKLAPTAYAMWLIINGIKSFLYSRLLTNDSEWKTDILLRISSITIHFLEQLPCRFKGAGIVANQIVK